MDFLNNMFNIPRIVIGFFLFNLGFFIPVVGIFPMLIGGYFLSRLIAEEYGIAIFFFIGVLLLIPSYYMTIPVFEKIGWEYGKVVRYTICLIASVMTWLSVGK